MCKKQFFRIKNKIVDYVNLSGNSEANGEDFWILRMTAQVKRRDWKNYHEIISQVKIDEYPLEKLVKSRIIEILERAIAAKMKTSKKEIVDKG